MKNFLSGFNYKKMTKTDAEHLMKSTFVLTLAVVAITALSIIRSGNTSLVFDVAILLVLAIGAYKRHFMSILIIFLYFFISKIFQLIGIATGAIEADPSAMVLGVIIGTLFTLAFFQGVLGALKYKKLTKKTPKKFFHKFYNYVCGAIGIILILGIIGILAPGIVSTEMVLTDSAKSSVVNVLCPFEDSEFSIEVEGNGGSGIIVEPSGLILTNDHILPQDEDMYLAHEQGCFVSIPNAKTGLQEEIYLAMPYVFSGWGELYDIAYLEIYDVYTDENGEAQGTFPKTFYSTEEMNECFIEDLNLGDEVMILGYPSISGGLNLTITEGIISSFSEYGEILTSAQITPGNSGGLAISKGNCFIGMASAYYSEDTGGLLGSIISIDQMYEFLDYVDSGELTEERLEEWLNGE